MTMDSFFYTGRVLKPWRSKINPLWWFQNDSEQTVDQAAWYQPSWPYWLRWLMWNVFRNPLQNFRGFVVGVQDRNYVVTGRNPVLAIQRDDLMPSELGFQWSVIWLAVPLPFVSYSGKSNVWYAGWQPNGFFGFKANGSIALPVALAYALSLVALIVL